MTMSLRRAFNRRMFSRVTLYSISKGSYNELNEWIEGSVSSKYAHVVLSSGNKFSQFDEGTSVSNMDSGLRIADYRQVYIRVKAGAKIGDKFGHQGEFYNILQNTNEEVYGFHGFMIEKDKKWRPDEK